MCARGAVNRRLPAPTRSLAARAYPPVGQIALNFFTGYVRDIDATLVVDKRMIAANYLRGWFAVDAAGASSLSRRCRPCTTACLL